MLRQAFSGGLVLATVSIVCTPVLAQSFGQGGTGRTGTGSAFGGGGGGVGGGGTGATGGFGAGGFGGGSFGAGALGGFGGQGGTGGAMGGSAFGGGAAGGGNFVTQGGNQFMLGNQGSGGFVGREAADIQQFFGGAQGGQGGQQQQFRNQARRQQFQLQNQANNANQRGRGGRGGDATQLRVTLRAGFDPPRPATAGLNGRLQNEVSQTLSSRLGVRNPTIDLAGQTATLQGTVASEEQRLLAEQILALQPGVTTVANELRVVPELPEPQEE